MRRTRSGTPVFVDGEGRSVVLVHGVLMDHRLWRLQVADLGRSYRVVRIDMLGHGDAPDPPGERSLDDFVGQLREAIVETCGDDATVLIGFSMGALVAQAYAIRYSGELAGLVLMNSVYERNPAERDAVGLRLRNLEEHGIESIITAALDRWHTPRERQDHGAIIAEMIGLMRDGDLGAKTKAYRVFATADPQTAGQLHRISCPTLVMTGEGDRGSPPHMSEKMAGAIPDARLRILPNHRHMMLAIDPASANRELRGFIDSLGRR